MGRYGGGKLSDFESYSRQAFLSWFSQSRRNDVKRDEDDLNAADPTGNLMDARKLARNINAYWRNFGVEANCTVTPVLDGVSRFWTISSDIGKKLNFWGKSEKSC